MKSATFPATPSLSITAGTRSAALSSSSRRFRRSACVSVSRAVILSTSSGGALWPRRSRAASLIGVSFLEYRRGFPQVGLDGRDWGRSWAGIGGDGAAQLVENKVKIGRAHV